MRFNLVSKFNKVLKFYNIKFVSDSFFTLLSHLIVGFSGLLLNTIISNYYGISDLGVVNQSLSIFMIITTLSNFGIQTSSQKHSSQFANSSGKLKIIFTSSIIATIITSFIIISFFLLLIYLFPVLIKSKQILDIVTLLLFSVPFFALNKTINNFLVGIRKMKIYSFIRTIRWLIVLTSIFYFSFFDYEIIYLAFSFIISEILIFIFLILNCKILIGKISLGWISKHINFSSKSLLSEFSWNFGTRLPILIIGFYLGDIEAGYYSYIEVFAFALLMIAGAFQKNFDPVFTQLWHQNKIEELNNKINKLFYTLLKLSIPSILGIYIFFETYTRIFMDNSYLEYNNILLLLLVGVFIRFIFDPFSSFLIMTNHLIENLYRVIIFLIINILMIYILINDYGLIGVSYAFIISTIFNFLVLNYLYVKKIKFSFIRVILKK